MSSQFQTLTALAIVALAVAWFIMRAIAKRRNPGCGGDCGCEASNLKAKLKR